MVMINKKCYFSVLCIGAEIHDLYEEYLGKLNLLFAIYQHTHSIYIYICVCTLLIPYVMMITMWLKNNLKEFLLGVLSYPMSPTTPKKTLTNHNLHVKVSPNTYMILIMHQPPHLVMWQIISYIRAWSSAPSLMSIEK